MIESSAAIEAPAGLICAGISANNIAVMIANCNSVCFIRLYFRDSV